MDTVKDYFLCITAAAILCAAVTVLLGKNTGIYAIGKLLCGLFLAVCVISPLTKLQIADVTDYLDSLSYDASDAVSYGEETAREVLCESIKSQTEAYILDKAASMAVQLCVEVTLSENDPPIPIAVSLTGTASPYAKLRLQQIIEDDLGIPKEAQNWIQ